MSGNKSLPSFHGAESGCSKPCMGKKIWFWWQEPGLPSALSYAGQTINSDYAISLGLPRWLCHKESACQFRRRGRCGFDPWARKIPWSRKWKLTPVFLPGESCGQRSLAGCSPWGRKDMNMTKHTGTHSFHWLNARHSIPARAVIKAKCYPLA